MIMMLLFGRGRVLSFFWNRYLLNCYFRCSFWSCNRTSAPGLFAKQSDPLERGWSASLHSSATFYVSEGAREPLRLQNESCREHYPERRPINPTKSYYEKQRTRRTRVALSPKSQANGAKAILPKHKSNEAIELSGVIKSYTKN